MSTIWAHSVIVIGTAAVVGPVIQTLDPLFPKDDGTPRDPNTPSRYAKPLSATGTGSPTHYLSTFSVTESIRASLDAAGLDSLNGLSFWRCDAETGLLALTNHVPSQANIGQPFSYINALAALNLAVIVPTIND